METFDNGHALAARTARTPSSLKRHASKQLASRPRAQAAGGDEAGRLIATLIRELFQTENSARWHPAREAERLGDAPPARAMRAVARHASAVLEELPGLAAAHGLPTSVGGLSAGRAFSAVRDKALDLFLTAEKSYRGTLLGMRHGVDLVKLLRDTAEAADDRVLVTFCNRWLAKRVPLLADVTSELAWFGAHPDRALAPNRTGFFARLARAAMRAVGTAERTLSEAATG
ncbi:MAG TPA: hypothetical protein VFS43_33120 [Polyangiaceae bacterium]|nr:hypothetical protein [Polyangiaceae bacterium]